MHSLQQGHQVGGISSRKGSTMSGGPGRGLKISYFLDKKNIAMAVLSLNLSNNITLQPYLALVSIEGVIQFYHVIMVAIALIYKTQMKEIWMFEQYLFDISISTLLIINIIILILHLLMLGMFSWIIIKNEGLISIKRHQLLKKICGIVFLLYLTALTLPLANIFFRTFLTSGQGPTYAGTITVGFINTVIYIVIQVVYRRVSTIKIQSKLIPWTQFDSLPETINLLSKVYCVAIQVLFSKKPSLLDQQFIFVFSLGICRLIAIIYQLVSPPYYSKPLKVLTTSINWIGFSIILTILLHQPSHQNIEIYQLIMIGPCLVIINYLVEYHWTNRIMNFQRSDDIKMEFQYVYFLTKVQEIMELFKSNSILEQKHAFNFFSSLVQHHSQACMKNDCLCQHLDSIIWIQTRAEDENQRVIQISTKEIEFLNQQNTFPFFSLNQLNGNFTFNKYQRNGYRKLKEVANNQGDESYDISVNGNDEVTISQINVNMTDNKEQDQSEEQENEEWIKIDIQLLWLSYFGNFFKQYYENGCVRFHSNYGLSILSANFQLVTLRNLFQCTNIIKNQSDKKLGILSGINQKVNEYYLNYEMMKLVEKQTGYENGFNPKQFGRIYSERPDDSNVSINQNEFIEQQTLQEDFKNSVNILGLYIFTFWKNIANSDKNIQEILKASVLFSTQLAHTQIAFTRLAEKNQSSNIHIYQQYAVVHKELINDKIAYDLYMQKYKHLMGIKRVYNHDNMKNNTQFHEMGILLCSAYQQNLGKILKSNEHLFEMTGYNKEDLKYSSFEIFINKLISNWHRHFMMKFLQDGQSQIINKRRINQFVLKKDGFIIPCEIFVKYHFTELYGYSFIGMFHPIKELELDNQKILTDQLIFLLCEHDTGKIVDMSENAEKQMKIDLEFLEENQNLLYNDLLIQDIIPQINIQQLKDNSENETRALQYSGDGTFSLSYLNNKLVNTYSQTKYEQVYQVKYYLFTEAYLNQTYKLNIVILKLLNTEKSLYSQQSKNDFDKRNNLNILDQVDDMSIKSLGGETGSESSMSSQSTRCSDIIKNQEIINRKQLPRKLKIVLQLVLCMFLTIIVVSIVNLNLQQTKFHKLITNIEVLRQNFEKLFFSARMRISIRVLISISNDFESQKSAIIPDKVNFLYNQTFRGQKGLLESQIYIDNADFDYSPEFANIVKSSSIPVEYLDDYASIYTQNQTMSYLVTTVSAKALEVYNLPLNKMRGRLAMQQINNPTSGFQPTDAEKAIFYVSQNGNNAMRSYNFQQANSFASDVKLFAQNNIQSMLITMVISLSTIIGVYLIVTPIVATIFDKQYTAIKLFLKLPQDQIEQCLTRSEKYYEKLIEEQNENIKSQKMQKLEKEAIENSESANQDHSSFFDVRSVSDSFSQVTLVRDASEISQRNVQLAQIYDQTFNIQNPFPKFAIKNGQLQSVGSHQKQDSKKDEIEQQENANNLKQSDVFFKIDKEKRKRRWKMVFVNILTMTILSTYFVGSFLLSYQTYSQIEYIVSSLIAIYFKDICLENVMIYLRENQIRNDTLLFSESGKVGSSSLIQTCMEYENQYRSIRKQKHPAFSLANEYMEIIETNKLCQTVFGDGDDYILKNCKTAYNGILNQGVSNVNQMMLQHMQRQDLKFLLNPSRSYKDLYELNKDDITIKLIEIKLFLLDKVFNDLKIKTTDSIGSYFQTQTNQYTILFACFMTLLTIFISIFIWALIKTKLYLWKVNLSLRILPLESMKKQQIEELESFLKN